MDEKLYPKPDDAEKIIAMVQGLSDDALEDVTPKYVYIFFCCSMKFLIFHVYYSYD